MKIYFLRHGIAVDRHPRGDAARELTPDGVELMRRQAAAFANLDLRLDAIVSSPLVRARQTAEIIAKALDIEDRLRQDERLAYGFSIGNLRAIVDENPRAQRLMLVGHNPDMPRVASELTGGCAIDMKKGGLIRIDAARIEPGAGVLEWHVPPIVLLACDG